MKLERELDKDEILERYLNTIYFGRGAYGVGAASRAYFGKDVRDIGVPGGVLPRRADPLARVGRRPGRPHGGHPPAGAPCSPRCARRATSPPRRRRTSAPWAFELRHRSPGPPRSCSCVDELAGDRRRVLHRGGRASRSPSSYGEDMLYGGGLRIYTTLDRDMQEAASTP